MNRKSQILVLIVVGATLAAGCAKLPLDNEAPASPLLSLAQPPAANNVAIEAAVDDPDGDMVALRFVATPASGPIQEFSWTSFVASGTSEVFFLGLGSGQWTVAATARDEWQEESAPRELPVTVP